MRKDDTLRTSHFRAMNERLDNGHAMFAKMDQAAALVGNGGPSDATAKDAWTNERGHMHAKIGHIVQTSPGTFKVVLNHDDADDTEQACATVREGEALIRRRTPRPPLRDASRDHDETAS
jgi:hypothetical protein